MQFKVQHGSENNVNVFTDFCEQRFIQDKSLCGSQIFGVTFLWPTHSLTNPCLGLSLCLRLLLCQVEPLLGFRILPSLVAPSSAHGMCTKLAAVKIIPFKNASDTAGNDSNWKTREETQELFSSRGWGLNTLCYRWRLGQGHLPTFTTNSLYSQVSVISAIKPWDSLLTVVWLSSGTCLRAKIIYFMTSLNSRLKYWHTGILKQTFF